MKGITAVPTVGRWNSATLWMGFNKLSSTWEEEEKCQNGEYFYLPNFISNPVPLSTLVRWREALFIKCLSQEQNTDNVSVVWAWTQTAWSWVERTTLRPSHLSWCLLHKTFQLHSSSLRVTRFAIDVTEKVYSNCAQEFCLFYLDIWMLLTLQV